MFSYRNDYGEGAHPKVLEALLKTNAETAPGYGTDRHCARAAELIRGRMGRSDGAVHFTVGGTQTNLLAIAAALRPHQAVISADSGHINTHETGAVEATGHKVLTVPSADGKLTPEQIEELCARHTDEHMVQPKMVYLSQPTELGTTYRKSELQAISGLCREKGLLLYVDGARLCCALAEKGNDLFLPDLAEYCDAFYIGGTKCGALFGEALVIMNPAIDRDFRFLLKQRGAMLAKGRLLGVQFAALMEGDLYEQIGRHENETADILRAGLREAGIPLLVESGTNQVFPILPDAGVTALREECEFELFGRQDRSRAVIRFVTSWAADRERTEAFARRLIEFGGIYR